MAAAITTAGRLSNAGASDGGEDAPVELDAEAQDLLASLHRQLLAENSAGGPKTLRSILMVLIRMSPEEREHCVELYNDLAPSEVPVNGDAGLPVNGNAGVASGVGGNGVSEASGSAAPAAPPAALAPAAPEALAAPAPPGAVPEGAGEAPQVPNDAVPPVVLQEAALLAQVERKSTALRDAPAELRRDRDLVLAAVRANGHALAYASESLKKDREVVLAAVQKQGNALRFAAYERRKDREIVLAAVQSDGNALAYAGEELRRDREVALTAVQKNSNAYREVASEMWKDREFVLAVVSRRGSAALRHAAPELRHDPTVLYAAKWGSPNAPTQ